MAEDVKQEMNSTPGCIPSKWTRNTVADGDWLQKYTIGPLSSRDNFLADKISAAELNIDEEIAARKAGDAYLSANLIGFSAEYFEFKDNVETSAENLSAALKEEIDRAKNAENNLDSRLNTERTDRINEDAKLQRQLDTLKAATDVIDVWGSYEQFSDGSGKYFPSETSALITDNDIIKIINDEYTPVTDTGNPTTGHQTYYQWKFNTPTPAQPGPDDGTWNFIGYTDPYYNIDEVNNLFDTMSAAIADTYLSAKGAVLTGRNIVITEDPNNPKITIATKDEVDFDKVSATTAYGSSAKFTNISSTNLYADNATLGTATFTDIVSNNISAKTNISAKSATIIDVSAKTLTALTATGTSAKFTNVSSTNLSSTNISATDLSATNASGTSAKFTNISSTNLTALTATGNSAEFGYFSGTNIRGGTNTATIDALIGSAQSGKDAYDKVSTAYWSAYKDSTHSGSGKLSANFSISAGENLDMEISNNIIKLNGKPAGVIHDDNLSGLGVQGDLLGLNSAINIYVPFIANQNRNSAIVEVGNTPVPYNMGTYNEGFAVYRNHTFNVGASTKTADLGTIINFTGMSVTHTAAGIGSFNQWSNYGEVFDLNYNCGDSYVKHLWVNEDGLNFIDYGNTNYSANLNFVNLKFYDNQNNIPGTNTKYADQYVDASSIYKWNNTSDIVTGQSATLYPGSGINFYNAGSNRLGIAVDYSTATEDSVTYVTALDGIPLSAGANYTEGRCITFDEQNNINLSSDINLNSKLVIDHYDESDSETYATANLESFKLDFSGSRDSVGSFRGQSATYRIDNLKIDNYSDEDNLYFAELDKSKLQISAYNKIGGYSVSSYTNIAKDYFETQKAGSNYPYYLKFDGKYISAGTNTSNVTAVQWHDIIHNATGTWVSGTSEQITIDAPYQTKIVVTASVPVSFNANTYYII